MVAQQSDQPFKELTMTKAYYSTVFAQPAGEVWEIIRDFNNYPVWVGGAGESRIEDGKTGDTVGAVRNVLYQGRQIRQRLLAHSDVERSQTYEFCGAASLPLTGFQATLRITPIVDGDRAFVEWWATFDCEATRRDELAGTLRGSFGKWLESLRTALADRQGLLESAPEAATSGNSRPFPQNLGLIYRLWLRDEVI
ncbi:MAG TPA: SRPBCC family protein [Bradyrhizobium sp.]|nr:SRPBCC family protein [Bradyrhizobium sp.]